ncbi:MAG: glycosyltransferase [Mariprofundaceae bacterium]|nr:glycosyltransferase [Mariprofundaceae bacterium]
MLTVVVIVNRFPVTSETFVVDHIVGLVKSGFEVTVLASECFQEDKQKIEKKEDIRFSLEILSKLKVSKSKIMRIFKLFSILGYANWKALFFTWERDLAFRSEPLMKKIIEIKPDIVHAHFGPNGMMASLATKRLNIPLFVNFHGYDVTVIPKRYGWSAYRRWLKDDAKAIVHSGFVEKRVKMHIMDNVQRVSLGVDTSKFKAPTRLQSWPHPLRLLIVGRAIYQKGIHVAIAMLRILKLRYAGFSPHLTVCGDGEDMLFLHACAKQHGVVQNITFLGDVAYEEVAVEMRRADILLVPSVTIQRGWEEAFCRVAIEGMAMGLSVIGSETGGLAETIGSGGRTCRAGSAWALFQEVSSVLERSTPALEADKAINRAQNFTIKRMRDEYAETIS